MIAAPRKSQFLRMGYRWLTQFADPLRTVRAVRNLGWYLRDWRRYRHMEDAEPLALVDSWPQLHDRTPRTPFDAHYFWMNRWAMRHIVAQKPSMHVDIGSCTTFVSLLSTIVPVTFVDYRPLDVQIEGLACLAGDILNLPFTDRVVKSLSSLSVVEHIGLGRYGDPMNPQGTRRACMELQRVLAPGGSLYLALPVGRERVCFNAHRIHRAQTIVDYFPELELAEFSGVDEDGRYAEQASLDEFSDSRSYAHGLFWFRRATK